MARGNILRRPIYRLRISIGTHGSAPPPKSPSIRLHLRAGAAGRSTAPASPATLLVHLISGMQFVLGINEPPRRVSAFGGIYRWKDGRNMPDVQPVLFEYDNVPVYMRLTLGTESTEVTRFMGSKGIIELREFSVSYTPQAGVDTAPSYYTASFPARLRNVYVKKWHEEHDPVPGQEPAPETITYNGNDYDDLKPHLWKFFEAVPVAKAVVQDAVFGHNAALGCHPLANESYFRKTPVHWDATSQTIKSLG